MKDIAMGIIANNGGTIKIYLHTILQLQLTDYQKRLNFALKVLQLADYENFITNLIMIDKANFHPNGQMNTQNGKIWAYKNQREIHEYIHSFN